MAAYDWCCTASINPSTDAIDIQNIAGYADNVKQSFSLGDRSFDVTLNSQWMEFIENTEDRVNVEGGAGAYDVMRCDLAYRPSPKDHHPFWRVWGEDFHLNRLTTSYRSLIEHMDDASTSEEEIDKALTQSREVIRALLMEAHFSDIMQSRAPPVESEVDDVTIQLTKMTVLWTPKPNGKDEADGNQDIVVRGHACSSCKSIQIHKRPTPIIATIALPLKTDKVSETIDETALPSRFRSPQNKVASWCRLRKPLEDPETYKPPGVGEVLMVRPTASGTHEILEGLTSNFFVIYKDGTVRTADEGVLCGYVRHLVIDCAERAGLRMQYSPILMEDASKGLWESAFITSSSRLIYPISQILIPEVSDEDGDTEDDGSNKSGVTFREFWTDPTLVDGNNQSSSPRWLDLLNELLIEGGYEAMIDA